eukprot:GFKZ01004297.1.p1 GENE.GFKZ01004297.1~~GFKZ01004297.1.p1  ORF type:complete len:1082 (+),score=130.78 GFKZ01004297.1:1168-4413(+)
MYPATQQKPNASAAAPLPPPPPKPISYATAPVPSYSHLPAHDVRPHLPHIRNPQWTAQPYPPATISHTLPTPQQHPPSLTHPATKDPTHQAQIPQIDPSPPPPPPHHYTHPINVVAAQSRQLPPPHQYMYLHPQVVAPVAHVPIGAAHYAHLPPSIWSPSHAQFHQSPPHQHHQRPIHTGPQPAHHLSVHASTHSPSLHLHHVHQSHHAQQVYPHTMSTPPIPHHDLHHQPLYQPHPVTYQYTHLQSAASSQPAKGTLALPQVTPTAVQYQETATAPPPYSPKLSGPDTSGNGSDTLPTNPVVKPDGQEPDPQYRSPERNPQGAANRTLASGRIGADFSQKPQNGSLSNKEESEKRLPSQEQRGSGSPRQRSHQLAGQTPRKPRKPYTITKSREVWTPEEHSRFVQALQLYDRDWKKIEAYIGTKTVLQIRSHAQKHFGKVTKYQTGEYIPPPRPKKRAVLPYPRSRSSTATKVTSNSCTGSDSGGGSDNAHFSNGATRNVSARNGNSSATVSGLRSSSSGGDQGTKAPDSNTVRSGSRPQTHQQRSREGLNATSEKPRPLEGANHPYYDCAAGRSYQERGLQRVRTLPPPNVLEGSRRAPLPPWNALQSVSGNSSQCHSRSLLCSSGSAETQDKNRLGTAYARHNAHENATHTPNRKDDLNPSTGQHLVTKEVTDRTLSSEPDLNSDQDMKAVRSAESGQAEVVRAEDGGRVPGPNNSLLVLSNCVDMMARNAVPESPPDDWATTPAARRAHRARVIRGRKPPLQPLGRYSDVDGVYEAADGRDSDTNHEKSTGDALDGARATEGLSRAASSHDNSLTAAPQTTTQSDRGRSPPAAQDDATRGAGHDPQRNSAGSGSNSDDAIAGFSGSDRPSGISSGGSGSGGSVESSDGGEEDPKSSNDGSGDDTNRQQSPSTRDSSPADPNSSGSRENTPNSIGDGNQANADLGKVGVPETRQDPAGTDRIPPARDGLAEKHCETGNKDVGSSCKANSIANLCSVVPSIGDKMRNEANGGGGKKRPRSPANGAAGVATEETADDEGRDRAKKKCNSINGIVHRTSVEVTRPGNGERKENHCGEGSPG